MVCGLVIIIAEVSIDTVRCHDDGLIEGSAVYPMSGVSMENEMIDFRAPRPIDPG